MPGIEEKDIWNFDFIKEVTQNDRPKLGRLWSRFLVANRDLNEVLILKKVFDYGEFGVCPWDIDAKYAEADSLRELLMPLMGGEKFYGEHLMVQLVIEKANKIPWLPKQKKLSNMKYLGVLLGLIGYGLKGKQERVGNGERVRFYEIVDKSVYNVCGEGDSVESRLIYPEIKDCFETRKGEILDKYNEVYFQERGVDTGVDSVDFREDRQALEACLPVDSGFSDKTLAIAGADDEIVIPLLKDDVVDIVYKDKRWGMCTVFEVLGKTAKAYWGWGDNQEIVTFKIKLVEKIYRMEAEGLVPVWSVV